MGKCFSTKVISSIAILAGPSTQSGPLVDTIHAKDSAISTYAIDAHAAHKTIFSRSNMGIPISLKEKKRKMTVLHVITLSFKSSVREGMQDVMIATTIYALFVSHISSDEKAEGRKSKTAQKLLQSKR